MEKAKIARFRTKLLELHARIKEEDKRMIQAVQEEDRPPGEHELSGAPSQSVAKEIALESSEKRIWQEAVDALERIDKGTYGQCQQCGRRIPERRLEAIPYTRFCIDCERKMERRGTVGQPS